MVERLQYKFIKITMFALLLVLLLVVGVTNGIYIYQIGEKSDQLLQMLVSNDGVFPEKDSEGGESSSPEKEPDKKKPDKKKPERERGNLLGFTMSEETPYETRYFSVIVSKSGEMQADVSHIAAISEERALRFAKRIIENQKESGYVRYYRYRVKETEENTLIVFVDCLNDFQTIRNFALVSVLVALGCLLLFFVLVLLLSRRAIRPILDSIEKQKQFVTDAGHEIKTPLAIISANTEVIEMYSGESEWTKSIRNQVHRLNELVKNMLTLAKLEEAGSHLQISECNLTDILKEVFSGFEALRVQKQLDLEIKAEEELIVQADSYGLYNLLSILADNAVKYTPEGGTIRVILQKRERQTKISFYNDCEKLPSGDLNHLFDRFYRADESRSRESGGYGIGLSIARSIVRAHKWKISVKRAEKGICFYLFIQ